MPTTPSPIRALISAVINAAAARLRVPGLNAGGQPPLQPQFLGQRTNPRRNAERKLLKQHGHRQYKKLQKAARAPRPVAESERKEA